MFKKVKDRIVAKAMSASSTPKAVIANIDHDAVVAVVRGEVAEVSKTMLFHYFIWLNLVFGVVGFFSRLCHNSNRRLIFCPPVA